MPSSPRPIACLSGKNKAIIITLISSCIGHMYTQLILVLNRHENDLKLCINRKRKHVNVRARSEQEQLCI